VNDSGTIEVVKRSGHREPFEVMKLAGAMWRGMQQTRGRFRNARDLAEAIHIHLKRTGTRSISSQELFQMMLRVLRKVRLGRAGEAIELHRLWRSARRGALLVVHGQDQVTFWDKSWLCEHVMRSWRLSPAAARVIAAKVEEELLTGDKVALARSDVLARMNACVDAFGLADAVPVRGGTT
jgi:hypothetical protein